MKNQKPLARITAVVFALAVFNVVFYTNGLPWFGSLSWVVFIAAINIFSLILFTPRILRGKVNLPYIGAGLVATAIVTWLSLWRANDTDRSLLSLAGMFLSGATFYSLAMPQQKLSALTEVLVIPLRLAKGYLSRIDKALGSLLRQLTSGFGFLRHKRLSHPRLGSLIRGALLSVFLIGLITPLLMIADPAFEKFIENLFSFDFTFSFEIKGRLAWTLIWGLFLAPLTLIRFKQSYSSLLQHPRFAKYDLEINIALLSVTGLLSLFLSVQFPYIFATVPQTQLHQFGVNTYSEYVRQGFAELSRVSVIVYSLAALAYIIGRQQKPAKSERNWTKILTLALLFVASLFILSILRRVYLYMGDNGLTLARYYGVLVLLGIQSWTLSLCGRLLLPRIPWRFVEVGLIGLVIALPTIVQPEELIIYHNPPTVNQELDYTYLARLSPDGAAGWVIAYQDAIEWLQQHPQVFESTQISNEEYRRLSYHTQTLRSILWRNQDLTRAYGSPEDLAILCRYSQTPGYCVHEPNAQDWFYTNFAERRAFVQLRSQIDPQQLGEAKQKFETATAIPRANTQQPSLDRSSDSPLIN